MNLHALLRMAVLLLSTHLTIYSQQSIPEVKPLAPNAASLFKVLERPVGTFTGTIPVQIPLCSVSSGPLSTSLSLYYNGMGGIKVEEPVGAVGLGFDFADGGGRIVQTVKGTPDDWPNGLLNPVVTRPNNFDCNDMNGDVYAAYYSPTTIDLEPDLFMYNFNGQSGKFFFREDGTIVMMQKTGIKITYVKNSNGITQWTITDEKGSTYLFTNKQYSDYAYYDGGSGFPTYGLSSASWYLTEVKDISQQNTLSFTHQITGEILITSSGGRMILPPTIYCGGMDLATHDYRVETDASELIVSRINARSGFVLINSSATRQDGYGRKVDSIMLFTPDSQLVKKYKLYYGYLGSYAKRMYLQTLSEFGSSGTDSITHKFEYHTDVSLPYRTDPYVDHWGFYNGYASSSVFPNFVYGNYRRTNLGTRTANPNYGKAGLLKKIKYPTGGYREFIYEGNTALVTFNPGLYHPDGTNSATRIIDPPTSEFNSNYGFISPFYIKYFAVNSNDGGTNFDLNTTVPYSCSTRVKLYKLTTANQSVGGTLMFDINYEDYNLNLVNGYYRMECYRDAGCSVTDIFARWSELTLSLGTVQTPHAPNINYNENIQTVGGLRVKEIRDYDPVANKIYTTEYKYKIYSGDSSLTSGLLISQPRYITALHPSGVGCSLNAVLATTKYPLAVEGGSYVVYPEVRTVTNGNGWIDRIYSFAPNGEPIGFPDIPAFDNSRYRGDLKQEKYYDNNGVLLKKVMTSYASAGSQIGQGGKKVKAYWDCGIRMGCLDIWYEGPSSPIEYGISPTKAYCNTYGINGYAKDIAQTIDSTFSSSGTFVNRTQYEYDTLNYGRMFLRKIKQYLSGGDIKSTTYRYPFSSTSSFVFGLNSSEQALKTSLNTKNMLQPIETVDSLIPASGSTILLGGAKYIYTINGLVTNLSKIIKYTTMTDSIEINFSQYDAAGNLNERYNTNDVKEVYLWGYNNTYPVAKVIGATYSAVLALVANSILQNPVSDAVLRTELNKIRTNLGGMAQVTTYTYKKGTGMSSETDPAGKTTYYEYDSQGRLSIIRDQNNNILKRFEYQLANPQ